MLEALLVISLSVGTPQTTTVAPDPALRRAARRAATRYERALIRYAPSRPGGGGPSRCDEVIGRFCFRFTEPDQSPPDTAPEHPAVSRARAAAIAAHRTWLAAEPGRADAAGPLLRYLLEDGATREGLAMARRHVARTGESPESLLLLGLALHESGAFPAAESAFDRARSGLPEATRARLDDVEALLEPGERRVYSRLSAGARSAYRDRLWRFADPSLLVAGNERRSAHYARHVRASFLDRAPNVAGRTSWGADSDEVVVRYGVPVHSERIRAPPARPDLESTMLRHYDRHAVSFVPPALMTHGLPAEPAPGEGAALERVRVRSSYAPVRLHEAGSLAVQTARFGAPGGAVLVASGRLGADADAGPPGSPRGILAVLDTLGHEVRRAAAPVVVGPDSAVWIRGEVEVEPGSWVYRLEVVDEATGRLGLAQHPVRVRPAGLPSLSDLLLAEPTAEEPRSRDGLVLRDLALPPGATVRIWAEARELGRVRGEARYEVEWWVEPAERPSVAGRVVRALGGWLGLGGGGPGPRLRWEAGSAEEVVPITFLVELDGLEPGLYRLGLRLHDRITDRAAVTTRLFRLDPAAPAGPPVAGSPRGRE